MDVLVKHALQIKIKIVLMSRRAKAGKKVVSDASKDGSTGLEKLKGRRLPRLRARFKLVTFTFVILAVLLLLCSLLLLDQSSKESVTTLKKRKETLDEGLESAFAPWPLRPTWSREYGTTSTKYVVSKIFLALQACNRNHMRDHYFPVIGRWQKEGDFSETRSV